MEILLRKNDAKSVITGDKQGLLRFEISIFFLRSASSRVQ